jgi:hypothetical protein
MPKRIPIKAVTQASKPKGTKMARKPEIIMSNSFRRNQKTNEKSNHVLKTEKKKVRRKKKIKTEFSKKQLRQLIRPMFCSTIYFGYATPEQVENTLNNMFGVDSREVEK